MDFAEIVTAFTQAVSLFAMLLKQKADAQKYAAASRQYASVLGDQAIVINGEAVKGEVFTGIAQYFDSLTEGEDTMRLGLQKQANFLEVALETGGMVPEDDVPAAKAALATWQDVSTTTIAASPKAPRLRAAS